MKCPQCNVETPDGGVYCHQCGARLPAEISDTPAQQPGPTPPPAAGEAPAGGDHIRAAAALRQAGADQLEETRWAGRFSPRAMLGNWLACGALTIGLIAAGAWLNKPWLWWSVIGAILLAWLYNLLLLLRRRTGVRYRLTTQRFVHETGMLWRVSDRIDLAEITDITCTQGPVERVLGLGTITITSLDRSHPRLALRGIEKAQQVAALIDQTRRAEQMRRGVLIEQT